MKTLSIFKRFLIGTGLAALALFLYASPTPARAAGEAWTGKYYANSSLSGSPVLVREDETINFDWGYSSPHYVLPADHFSVRWSTRSHFEDGRYRFRTGTDDGVRLYVDGKLILDKWYDMSEMANYAYVKLTAGYHQVSMEYYEHHGTAVARLDWERVAGREVGNIITCAGTTDSWIKVYRWEGGQWLDLTPRGATSASANGFLKLDGMLVDEGIHGSSGHPYRVELWANGSLIRSTGNVAAGEPEFRVRAWEDNYTPWGCPAL